MTCAPMEQGLSIARANNSPCQDQPPPSAELISWVATRLAACSRWGIACSPCGLRSTFLDSAPWGPVSALSAPHLETRAGPGKAKTLLVKTHPGSVAPVESLQPASPQVVHS